MSETPEPAGFDESEARTEHELVVPTQEEIETVQPAPNADSDDFWNSETAQEISDVPQQTSDEDWSGLEDGVPGAELDGVSEHSEWEEKLGRRAVIVPAHASEQDERPERAARVERTMTVLDMPADYRERLAQLASKQDES